MILSSCNVKVMITTRNEVGLTSVVKPSSFVIKNKSNENLSLLWDGVQDFTHIALSTLLSSNTFLSSVAFARLLSLHHHAHDLDVAHRELAASQAATARTTRCGRHPTLPLTHAHTHTRTHARTHTHEHTPERG